MFPEITSQTSPLKDYFDSSSLTGVLRRTQPPTDEIMERKFFPQTRQQRPIYYTTTWSGALDYEYDLASVYARLWPNLFKGYIETMVPFEMLEHNIIIKMTPKEKFNINLEIIEIKKAKPKIIEPDWV
jgi:hypothetical protein